MAPVPPASAAVASVFPTRLAFVFHRGARVGWVLADVLGDRAVGNSALVVARGAAPVPVDLLVGLRGILVPGFLSHAGLV